MFSQQLMLKLDLWEHISTALEKRLPRSYIKCHKISGTIIVMCQSLMVSYSRRPPSEAHRGATSFFLNNRDYSSLFMRHVCFPMCMVARSVELVRTSRASSCRSSSVSASRARFFSCISICSQT